MNKKTKLINKLKEYFIILENCYGDCYNCNFNLKCFEKYMNKKIAIIGGQNNLDRTIKKNIEKTWPDWKIKYANDYLMISKHSDKFKLHKETEEN